MMEYSNKIKFMMNLYSQIPNINKASWLNNSVKASFNAIKSTIYQNEIINSYNMLEIYLICLHLNETVQGTIF